MSMNPSQDPTSPGPLPGVVADAPDVLQNNKNAPSFYQDGDMPARTQPSYINNVARVRAPARKQDGAVRIF